MTSDPVCIDAGEPVQAALALMNDESIRHLPVMHENRLVGVISDRDIAQALAVSSRPTLIVEEAMTPNPYSVLPENVFSDVLRVMAANRLGCVIVKDGGENIVGIFTSTDAVRLLADLVD